ncbi:hypothetical protein QEM15_003761 [Pseudomonas putida]|nr:hypothetical protein [Pseudomonas putida]
MAVPAGPTEARYVGNGVTTVFTIPFLLILPTDLEVWLNGVEQSSGYVVTGAGNPTSTLTFLTPPAVGADIYIALDVPFERLNDYQENGDFLATTVNRDYDRIWQALKQLLRFSTRSPQLGKFDVDGAGWYRAKGNGLRDLADPVAEQDAVNVRSMRAMIEQALAGIVGGVGWFLQAGVGAIARTFQSKMRETFSVEDFGETSGDSSAIINAAALALFNAGGGRLEFTKPRYLVGQPIIIYSNVHYVGKGRAATTIEAIAGSNTDIFKTKDFDSLTGVGNISDAPNGFGINGFTLEGNYLDLSDGKTWRNSDTVLNYSGSGIKIFGSRFDIDVEIYNVAKNALYVEGIGSFIENQEHASRIRVTGRISGKEGIVFRGPGDIYLEYIIFGLTGHLPYTQRLTAINNFSDIYAGTNVDGLVLDNSPPYTGHAEIGLVHMYANSYGYGVRTRGVNRFNVKHVVSENSRGGYYLGDGAHGVIGILESRANGRFPDSYAGASFTPLPDIVVDNGNIWQLTGQMRVYRYSPSQDLPDYAVQILGSCNNLTITYAAQLQGDFIPLDASFLKVSGSNNNIKFQALRIRGNGVYVSGETNRIDGVIDTIYSGTAFIRDGSAAFGNIVDITAAGLTADSVGFQSIGTVGSEKIRLALSGSSGYTQFTGDPMAALNRACTWDIAASNGNTLNGKTTEDYIEVAVPNTPISGEINVPHNFLYKPNRIQIDPQLNFPGTAPNQILMIGVKDNARALDGADAITATYVTISYRWAALPTSGGANVQVRIK